MNITVNNIRFGLREKADIHLYCGRETSYKPRPDLINANLGNPFPMNDESEREKICQEYEDMLATNPEHPHWKIIKRIAERAKEGKKIALYCHCAPKQCHCDTIKKLALTL